MRLSVISMDIDWTVDTVFYLFQSLLVHRKIVLRDSRLKQAVLGDYQ